MLNRHVVRDVRCAFLATGCIITLVSATAGRTIAAAAAVNQSDSAAAASAAVAAADRESQVEIKVGAVFSAQDSLSCGTDATDDAQQCIEGLTWPPSRFQVTCQEAEAGRGDWLIRFPSPQPVGNATNDLVAMEWYAARNEDKSLKTVPAVVVVHESGRGMTAGRFIARGLNAQGLHTFLLHLPGYGARRTKTPEDIAALLAILRQAVADVRRARDAVAVLPSVDPRVIGLQGTSLGGFVTATVAGLDRGYDRVFILLAGGNLHEVVLQGSKDAAGIREKLKASGLDDQQIIELSRPIEPMRLAHRISANSTWLYSGRYDDVVPPACSLALVRAAGLPAEHHIELPADHYSGVVFLPAVLLQIRDRMINNLPDAIPSAAP